MFKNVAGQGAYVFAWDANAQQPKTGDAANITATLSKDGAAPAALGDVNPTEIGGGVYWFDFTQAETNADALALIPSSSTADVELEPLEIYTVDREGLVDDIWDEILSGATHNVPSSAGRRLRQLEQAFVLHDGTLQGATAGTAQLDTGASALDNFYDHSIIVIVAGTGIGQARALDNYVGSTRTGDVSPNWVTIPDATSDFEIRAFSVTHVNHMEPDVIGAAQFDEATAFPLKSADAGATEVARTGADGDTLKTLSDQIDGTSTFNPATDEVDVGKVKGTGVAGVDDFKADVSGLSTFDPATQEVDVGKVKGVGVAGVDDFKADVSALATAAALAAHDAALAAHDGNLAAVAAAMALESTAQAIKLKTDNLPGSPAATGDQMALTAAALTAIADEIRDSKWTAGGTNTVGFLFACIASMARGNFYKEGNAYKYYDDDDTGSKDGTLLFTLTLTPGSNERISS